VPSPLRPCSSSAASALTPSSSGLWKGIPTSLAHLRFEFPTAPSLLVYSSHRTILVHISLNTAVGVFAFLFPSIFMVIFNSSVLSLATSQVIISFIELSLSEIWFPYAKLIVSIPAPKLLPSQTLTAYF